MFQPAESLIDWLLAASVVQGAAIAVVAWRRRGTSPALASFAIAVGSVAVLSLLDLLEDGPHAALVASIALLWTIWVPAPALWLYVRTLAGLPAPSRGRDLLHFVPALAMIPPSVWLALRVHRAGVEALLLPDVLPVWTTWNLLLLAGTLVGLLGYLGASAYWLRRHAAALRDVVSDTSAHELRWLRQMLVLALAIGVAWALGGLFDASWPALLLGLVQPLVLLYIGVRALQQPGILGLAWLEQAARDTRRPESTAHPEPHPAAPPRPHDAAATSSSDPPRPAYARSGLDASRAVALAAALEALMHSEKPYLEDDLTLPGLAARLATSPHALSQALNQQLGTNFHDYIARWRIDDVKRCLRDPAYDGQTILEIALAAGFRSKSAFHEAFRRETGETPSRYRASRGHADTAPGRASPD